MNLDGTLEVRQKFAGLHPSDAKIADAVKIERINSILECKITHKKQLKRSMFQQAKRHSQMHEYLTDLPHIESRNELGLKVSERDAPPRIVAKADKVYIGVNDKSQALINED